MARRKTGWEENTRPISARFNLDDPNQKKAYEIIKKYRAYGRSIQSILTTALLASEKEQFPEPTLGDVAAHQIMVSVRELGELIEELRHLRMQVGSQPATEDDVTDDTDYADQVVNFMAKRRRGQQ